MSRAMKPSTAQVINPILTNHARGYKAPTGFIGNFLFPKVTVPQRSPEVIRFGKESFRKLKTRRERGGRVLRIKYGYDSETVSLVQDALGATVACEDREDAQVPGIDVMSRAVTTTQNILQRGYKADHAELARDAAQYPASNVETLAGTERWDDAASDPKEQVFDAKATVRRKIGMEPSLLILPYEVRRKLKLHPKVIDQYKYTASDGQRPTVNDGMLRAYLEMPIVAFGDALVLGEEQYEDEDAQDIWEPTRSSPMSPRTANATPPPWATNTSSVTTRSSKERSGTTITSNGTPT